MNEASIKFNKNLKGSPKNQYSSQPQIPQDRGKILQPLKFRDAPKTPQPSNPMLAPKIVPDDTLTIETKKVKSHYMHSRSIQLKPLQQVLGEIKEDSSQHSGENYPVLKQDEVTRGNIFFTILRRNKNYADLRRITVFLDTISIIKLFNCTKIFKLNEWMKAFHRILKDRVLRDLQIKLSQTNQLDYQCEQFLFWDHFIDFRRVLINHTQKYNQCCHSVSLESSSISKDIDRTFSEDCFFQNYQNRQKLFNVLVALSHILPSVGYVQGLNQIAGVLLIKGLTDQHTFWFMVYLMKKLMIQEIYTNSFQMLKFLNFNVAVFLRNYMPQLSQLFLEKEIDLSYFTTRWFLTLFSFDLPQPLVYDQIYLELIKLWNLLFLGSWKELVKMSLAILKMNYDYLVMNQLEMDDIYDLLKNQLFDKLDEGLDKQNKLMEFYKSIKVTNKMISQLREIYQKKQFFQNQGYPNTQQLEDNLILKNQNYKGQEGFKPDLKEKEKRKYWRMNDRLIGYKRSVMGSLNGLLGSISSSEVNDKDSDDRDNPISSEQNFLNELFPLLLNKGEPSIIQFIPSSSLVASEEKKNIFINSNNPPQFIQYQFKTLKVSSQLPQKTPLSKTHRTQLPQGQKQSGSPKQAFSLPFTIPKSSEGDQECNINADDIISQSSKYAGGSLLGHLISQTENNKTKGALQYKQQTIQLRGDIKNEDSSYQINPESQPQKFQNLIVNQFKSTQ